MVDTNVCGLFIYTQWESREQTPSGRENSARNWGWPLKRILEYRVCMGVEKNGVL